MVLVPWVAGAQMLSDRAPPKHRIVHRNLLALRANPLGAGWEGKFSYRQRMFLTQSLALRDNFIGLGLSPSLTPTYARIGPYLEVQPATFIGFFFSWELFQYFGTFNQVQSFPSAQADYSEPALRMRTAGYPAAGNIFTAGVNVNLRFGPIVVRDTLKLLRPDVALTPGDTVFYDALTDLLMPDRRVSVTNDLDVLWQTPLNGFFAGIRYSAATPVYGEENGPADNSTHRLGPMLAWRIFDRDGARFNQPLIAVIVNWYAKHPHRTGQQTSAALPYFALGFQTCGDLLPLDPE